MPSVPSFPGARLEADHQAARREYAGYEQQETFVFTLPAGTAFTEQGHFSGRFDAIRVTTHAPSIDYRVKFRGEAPGSFFRTSTTEGVTHAIRGEILEARDPAGVGGQVCFVTAYFASRAIERRESRRGPLAADVRPREQGAPEQIEPR